MLTCQAFTLLSGAEQVRELSWSEGPLVEVHGRTGTSLFYRLSDGYAEMRFQQRPDASLMIGCFQENDPRFDALLNALPVDISTLLYPTGFTGD